jgi:phosphoglycolate phosphatase-like HAD superfamily hydrolase
MTVYVFDVEGTLIVRLAGVAGLVDAQACADDVARSKPHPDLFACALARVGRTGNDIAVGDTPYNAKAARAAGLEATGLTCGGFTAEQLRAAGCRVVCRDPADLRDHLVSADAARPTRSRHA